MELITKTQPSGTTRYTFTRQTERFWDDGRHSVSDYSESTNVRNGANTIEYEGGPRYLYRADGSRIPNWKYCTHSRQTTTRIQPCIWMGGRRYDYNHLTIRENGICFPGCKTDWRGTQFPTMPDAPSLDDVAGKVWNDIAHRANDDFLLLEDVAGFVSGRSLWSAIKGVASGAQMLARTTSQLRKVRRAFGGKESLYQLWQSAKEELCRVIGLRLGYRFSFKTTLHDIDLTCGWVDGFHSYLQQIQRRARFTLPYSATVVARNDAESTLSSTVTRYMYSPLFDDSVISWVPVSGAQQVASSVQKCTIVAHASVRYTADREKLGRYLQRQTGLDRPLSTLWAIVPLSFLIDYIVPVQGMLSYVDNWLNDYDISTTFEAAWAIKHSYQQLVVRFPVINAFSSGGWFSGTGASCTYTRSEDFQRFPISSSMIRDQFPPLIDAGNNWYRRLGTGLEILSQLRHR